MWSFATLVTLVARRLRCDSESRGAKHITVHDLPRCQQSANFEVHLLSSWPIAFAFASFVARQEMHLSKNCFGHRKSDFFFMDILK